MNPAQIRRIKCPHCGWIRTIDVRVVEDEVMATVTQGMSEALKSSSERIEALLADAELEEANAWLNMPACPHCGKAYQYNVLTGKVAR